MAVSPPPASILPSSTRPIPDKIPEELDTNVYQNVWRQIVKDIEIGGPALCPVPYIDKAHYFDLLNIFVEVDEPMVDSIRSTFTKNKKYKYVGKWKNVVAFLTENSDRINDIVQLRDQTALTGGGKAIDHLMTGKQVNVERDYRLHIESPKVHALHFKMDPRIAVGVDRTKPGLDAPASLLVIAEVFSGCNVHVQSGDDSDSNDDEVGADTYTPPNDPIPLAFGALRIKLETNGVFKSPPHVVSSADLAGLKRWIFTEGRVPKESECIKTLSAGLTYNVDKRRRTYLEYRDQPDQPSSLIPGLPSTRRKKSKKHRHHHHHRELDPTDEN